MSVMLFCQNEVDRLLGMMRYHHRDLINVIRRSSYFLHRLLSMQKSMNRTEQYFEIEFIERMIWYALVSNKVAFILQYQENIPFHDLSLDYEKAKVIACTKRQLYEDLSHLDYNMCTNDGNGFMEEKWLEPFNDICHYFLL